MEKAILEWRGGRTRERVERERGQREHSHFTNQTDPIYERGKLTEDPSPKKKHWRLSPRPTLGQGISDPISFAQLVLVVVGSAPPPPF